MNTSSRTSGWRDAVEARASAAGDEAVRRLGSGHQALIRHALERDVEHAGPALHSAAGRRGDDGTYDGNPPFPHVDAIIEGDSGRRLQLQRIIDALRRTLAEPRGSLELLASAENRIDALTDAEPDQLAAAKLAMRSVKAAARADLARFAPDQAKRRDKTVVE